MIKEAFRYLSKANFGGNGSPSERRNYYIGISLLATLQVLDFATTTVGINKFGPSSELNPLIASLATHYGFLGIAAYNGAEAVIGVSAISISQSKLGYSWTNRFFVGASIIGTGVVINNLWYLS